MFLIGSLSCPAGVTPFEDMTARHAITIIYRFDVKYYALRVSILSFAYLLAISWKAVNCASPE